jgi:hypothetical protein
MSHSRSQRTIVSTQVVLLQCKEHSSLSAREDTVLKSPEQTADADCDAYRQGVAMTNVTTMPYTLGTLLL